MWGFRPSRPSRVVFMSPGADSPRAGATLRRER